MIPVLDGLGRQLSGPDGRPLWRRTKADSELNGLDQFAFWYSDPGGAKRKMAVWEYMEAYERIATTRADGSSGGIAPFELNDSQIYLYKEMCAMRASGRPVRINDGKSRQMGGSTFVAGFFFPLTAFVPGKRCGIVADVAAHASGLFEKYLLLYETMPEALKKHVRKQAKNAYELTFDYGRGVRSSIKVLVQGEGAGRSSTFNYLHESEVAFWPDIAGTCLALDNTVSDADPGSVIFRETTANGVNEWKQMFDRGLAGRGLFKSVFVPWHWERTYRSRYDGHALTPYEEGLKAKGLGLDQIQWWHEKWLTAGEDYDRMAQEYPSDVTEMFVSSGSSVFNAKTVGKRKDEIMKSRPLRTGYYRYSKAVSRDGGRIELSDISWVDDPHGTVRIYREPEASHPYVMVNDPANGGDDYWVTQLVDNSDLTQCAIFRKQGRRCDADEATFQSYCLYREYFDRSHRVLVAGEVNTTSYFVNTMKRLGVKDVYVDRDTEGISGRLQMSYGYRLKQDNRQRLIDDLVIAFRESGGRIINDFDTISEIETFSYIRSGKLGKEKAQAESGAHDDTVTAYAGVMLVRQAFSASVIEPAEEMRRRATGKANPLAGKGGSAQRRYMEW